MSEFERDAVDVAREHARMERARSLRSYLVGIALAAVLLGSVVPLVWLVGR